MTSLFGDNSLTEQKETDTEPGRVEWHLHPIYVWPAQTRGSVLASGLTMLSAKDVALVCSYSVCSPDRLRAITRRGYRNRIANENADDVVVATTHKENPYPHRWTPFYKQRTTDANEIMHIRGKQIMYERL